MNKLILTTITTILMVNIIGCTAKLPDDNVTSSQSEQTTMEADSDRSMYESLPLPENADLVGDDPQKIAIDAFGMSEPVEGNFQEQVSLVDQTETKAVVTLTQTGLPDDSVEGTRYWLEFTRNEQQKWQLNWGGRQVRCYYGRGSQKWSTQTCS